MKNKLELLGSFDQTTDSMIISDPCYSFEENSNPFAGGELNNVMPGKYNAYIMAVNKGDWGIRNKFLMAVHESFADRKTFDWISSKFHVGVDSGQAGIYDAKYFRDDSLCSPELIEYKYMGVVSKWIYSKEEKGDAWYAINCVKTLDEGGPSAGIIPYGVVSSSGFGDGIYHCEYAIDKDTSKIIAVRITFM